MKLAIPCALALVLAGTASAELQLNYTLFADDQLYAYISTSDSQLGTLVNDIYYNSCGNATAACSGSVSLSAGTTYYLHLEVFNNTGSGDFGGLFSLSDASASFANGTQSMVSDAAYWRTGYAGRATFTAPSSVAQQTTAVAWAGTPAGSAVNYGTYNSYYHDAVTLGTSADLLWAADSQSSPGGSSRANGACTGCGVFFSTTITADTTATPEPGTIALSGTIFAAGLFFRRYRR